MNKSLVLLIFRHFGDPFLPVALNHFPGYWIHSHPTLTWPEVRHTMPGMTTLSFDTHKAVKALKEAGFDDGQAEAVVATVGEAIGGNVATKADIAEVKGELTLVKWMLGVNLAFSLALLLKTFFA